MSRRLPESAVELLGEAVAELGRAAPDGQARARGRPRRRLRAEHVRRLGGDADRPAPPGRARGDGGRELRELEAATTDRFGLLPEPVENLFAIQEVRIKFARLGADYLVFRGGRATVGPLVLGLGELRGAARPDRHRDLHDRPE